MKRSTMLTISSFMSILLLSIHMTQDALREKPGTMAAGSVNLVVIVILVVYLCGTVLLMGRRSGYVIMMLCGLTAVGMPVLHLTGSNFIAAKHSDAFFFLWTLIALGVAGLFTIILAARGVWRPQEDQ